MPLLSIIIDYNGFFERLINYENYNFFKVVLFPV